MAAELGEMIRRLVQEGHATPIEPEERVGRLVIPRPGVGFRPVSGDADGAGPETLNM